MNQNTSDQRGKYIVYADDIAMSLATNDLEEARRVARLIAATRNYRSVRLIGRLDRANGTWQPIEEQFAA